MTPGAVLRHQSMYRRLVGMTPPEHRSRHAEEQILLFGDLLQMGERPLRLWMRVFPDLISVFAEDWRAARPHLARISLGILSIGPITLGVIVGSISIDEYDDVSILFPLVAIALLIQGGFTLLWLSRRLDRWGSQVGALFLAGEIAALVFGALVILDPTAGQGRVIAGLIVAGHALVGLVTAFGSRRQEHAA